jgi:DNA-binding transcriptional ArsR family regulator
MFDVSIACAYAHMSMRANATGKRIRKRSSPTESGDELDLVFDAVARYFALLSDPTRLKILHAICTSEQSVSAIVAATGATQTNVSRHLALMHQAGVVSRRRDGPAVFYQVIDPEFVEICRTVCVRIAGRIEAGEPLKRDLLDFAAQR